MILQPNFHHYPEKADSPIEVTLFGIVIFESDEQFQKASLSISATLSGIVMFVSDEHSEKAP